MVSIEEYFGVGLFILRHVQIVRDMKRWCVIFWGMLWYFGLWIVWIFLVSLEMLEYVWVFHYVNENVSISISSIISERVPCYFMWWNFQPDSIKLQDYWIKCQSFPVRQWGLYVLLVAILLDSWIDDSTVVRCNTCMGTKRNISTPYSQSRYRN